MKKFWDQLKPQERRWVIIIGVVVFVVLNYFMVFPRFKEWKLNAARIQDAQKRMSQYTSEINRMASYQKILNNFDPADTGVLPEDQAYNFEAFFRDRARDCGVQIQSVNPRKPETNDFFVKRQTAIEVVSKEVNLLHFLFSLGSSSSQMRVRSMSLHPVEPNRYQLRATITIVADYLRKSPTATRASTAAVPDLKGGSSPSANSTNRLISTNKPGPTQTRSGSTQTNRRGTGPITIPAPPLPQH